MEFLCPNGHRIRCPAEQAGRAAKCPRCGVKFRVPQPTDQEVSAAGSSDSNFSRPEFIESTGSSRRLPTGSPQKEQQIEFLCPNGHRLHGAANLQGRPGECPECGSRFRIPTYDDVAPGEATEHNISIGGVDGQGSDALKRGHASESNAASPGQTMASLVTKLWDIKPNGSHVELRMRDGETIVAEQFFKKLSQQNHQGVFSVKDEHGGLSLVVVAWDAVARATLRGLHEVPHAFGE